MNVYVFFHSHHELITEIKVMFLIILYCSRVIFLKTYIPVYSTSLDKGLSTRKPIE